MHTQILHAVRFNSVRDLNLLSQFARDVLKLTMIVVILNIIVEERERQTDRQIDRQRKRDRDSQQWLRHHRHQNNLMP